MIDILDAINSLCPGSEWTLNGKTYSGLNWLDKKNPKPSESEINDEINRLQAEYDSKEYQRQRTSEYPDITEQLDMLWHAIDAGKLNKTSDFYTTLKAVKDKYPKSE